MTYRSYFALPALVVALTSCTPGPDKLKEILIKHPDVMVDAIKKNPEPILLALEEGRRTLQMVTREKKEQKTQEMIQEAERTPFSPELDPDRAIRGPAKGKVLVIEYVDLGSATSLATDALYQFLRNEYATELRWMTKHMLAGNNRNGQEIARQIEAALIQDPEKGFKFRDYIFAHYGLLGSQDAATFLDNAAKKVGLNTARIKKVKDSDTVSRRIESDIREARRLNFNRPPALLVAGVPLAEIPHQDTLRGILDRAIKGTRGTASVPPAKHPPATPNKR